MRLSVLLCLWIFILCCTGSAGRVCRMLGVQPGTAAACATLVALLSGVRFDVAPSVSVQPAALLLLVGYAVLAAGAPGDALELLLATVLAGTLGWLFTTLFPAFYEPGLLVALPAAVVSRLFLPSARKGLLCTGLAPLFYGVIAALSDRYLFDTATFALGSAVQLDAELAGAFLVALSYAAPVKRRAARTARQSFFIK